jgi:hypothetical protein
MNTPKDMKLIMESWRKFLVLEDPSYDDQMGAIEDQLSRGSEKLKRVQYVAKYRRTSPNYQKVRGKATLGGKKLSKIEVKYIENGGMTPLKTKLARFLIDNGYEENRDSAESRTEEWEKQRVKAYIHAMAALGYCWLLRSPDDKEVDDAKDYFKLGLDIIQARMKKSKLNKKYPPIIMRTLRNSISRKRPLKGSVAKIEKALGFQ